MINRPSLGDFMRSYTVGSLIHSNQLLSVSPDTLLTSKETSKNEIRSSKNENFARQKSTSNIVALQNNQRFSIEPRKNKILLDTALEQNQQLSYKCRKGTCGACTVQVLNGYFQLSAPNDLEQNKLDKKISHQYRLACQTFIK
jgi:2Fe-2S ferredoxin